MKKAIFILSLLPVALQAQNYLFEITPTNGQFRVLITDDTKEAYPRDIVDYGLLDTANFSALAYNLIEQAKTKEASQMAQTFLAELKAEQVNQAFGAIVPLDYNAHIAAQLATAYDGQYLYEVRGTATNLQVYITGTQLRRTSNNNLLGTVTPITANWIIATPTAQAGINLYLYGNTWVGRNSSNQIVTLKRL